MLATLVVMAISAMIAGSLLFAVRAEVGAAKAVTDGEKAWAATVAGLQRAVQVLTSVEGDASVWRDNPDLFFNQLVIDDGAEQWYFTVYGPLDGDDRAVRYGLIDEGGKISINTASEGTIRNLPGVTPEMADALLDYRDRDENPRPQGAEQDYYDRLPRPYMIRNGPFASVEELLLVRGFTGPVVYGEDANMNGILDPNEDDGDESFPPDDGDGVLNRGLLGLCTVVTYGPDVDSLGEARINLNGTTRDLGALEEAGLPRETVEFILAYREDGGRFTHASQLLEMEHVLARDSRRNPTLRRGTRIRSAVNGDVLPTVLDRLTVSGGGGGGRGGSGRLVGKLNINTASRAALQALAEIDAEQAQRIVDIRSTLDEAQLATPAWLYTTGITTAEQFRTFAPALTTQSYQYRIRVVGYGVPGGRYRIMEAMLDLGQDAPRLFYVRDLTRLGLPFALDPDQQEAGR